MAMTSWIVDRRKDNPNKSAANRERFIRRYKDHIRGTVNQQIQKRSIKEMEQAADIKIPKKNIQEPTFRQNNDGSHDHVRPGNDQYNTGDQIKKPSGGQGSGGAGQGDGGDMDDSFMFTLTKDEFMSLLFEDMELPNLAKSVLAETPAVKWHRAGYSRSGNPSNLAVGKTLSQAIGRQLAMNSYFDNELSELEKDEDKNKIEIEELKAKKNAVLFLEDRDLRYRSKVSTPDPISKAVMFCVMDVSASMYQHHKDLAKKFFLLLYLFLTKKYNSVEVVFIRHTDSAEEVNEEEFFYGKKSGSTNVMSALSLVEKIIQARFNDGSSNLYFAQASDGDAFGSDSAESGFFLKSNLLPKLKYAAYLEVLEDDRKALKNTELWDAYETYCLNNDSFAMRKVSEQSQIYPVLRGLFEKKKERV